MIDMTIEQDDAAVDAAIRSNKPGQQYEKGQRSGLLLPAQQPKPDADMDGRSSASTAEGEEGEEVHGSLRAGMVQTSRGVRVCHSDIILQDSSLAGPQCAPDEDRLLLLQLSMIQPALVDLPVHMQARCLLSAAAWRFPS